MQNLPRDELSIRYLTNKDSIARCKRYVQYFAKDNREWNRLIAKHYPAMLLQPRRDEERIVDLAKQYKSPHKWSESDLKTLATEPDEHEKVPEGGELSEVFFYEVIYRWMSQYVHATVSGIASHECDSGEIFKVGPQGRGVDVRRHASRTAYVSVLLNNTRLARSINFDFPKELGKQLEALAQSSP